MWQSHQKITRWTSTRFRPWAPHELKSRREDHSTDQGIGWRRLLSRGTHIGNPCLVTINHGFLSRLCKGDLEWSLFDWVMFCSDRTIAWNCCVYSKLSQAQGTIHLDPCLVMCWVMNCCWPNQERCQTNLQIYVNDRHFSHLFTLDITP